MNNPAQDLLRREKIEQLGITESRMNRLAGGSLL